SAGTLTVASLVLNDGSVLEYELGDMSDSIEVAGDLTLDGVLNVTDAGGFGPGVYHLITYGGALTDNQLELGTLPDDVTGSDLLVQTAFPGEVNLAYTAGGALAFWDGAGPAGNGSVDGGSGVWDAAASRWTDVDGVTNGPWG